MKKRPLCMAVLSLVAVLWLLPAGIWIKEPSPADKGHADTLTGEVCRMESTKSGQAVYLKHSNISDTGIILVYFDAEQSFSIGNTIRIQGQFELKNLEEPANPGQFNARLYYQTRDIVLLCYAKKAEVVEDSVHLLPQLLYQVRKELGKRCIALLGEEQGGVLKAMLLGDKTELHTGIRDVYQKSGMSHLLAISGLHVSIFGMSLYRLLRKLGCSYSMAGCPAMGLVLLYGSVTGMGTSTTRAVIMFLLAVTGDILGKSYDMLTALAVAALLLLADQPLYALDASFLLSFGAVLGIGLVYPAFHSLFPTEKKWAQAFLISLSVQTLTIPFIQNFYYQVPVYSIFLNLLVIPLMTILMFCGIAAVALSFLSWKIAFIPSLICNVILYIYENLGSFTLKLPGAVMICGKPHVWQMILYYLGIGSFVFWRYQAEKRAKRQIEAGEEGEIGESGMRFQRLGFVAAYLLLNLCLSLRAHSGLTFTMLDVGQGDGLFLRTDSGTTCLIDGGSSSVKEVGEYRILPFLKEEGISTLDYVMVTHTDSDHISGIKELLSVTGEPGEVKVGTLLLTEQGEKEEAGKQLKELAASKGIFVSVVKQGDVLLDKSTEIACLHPKGGAEYTDQNASSMVLKVTYGEFSLLLTGDLEEEGERDILDEHCLGTCDVLKAGHHGSKSSTTEAWLETVNPQLTVISCGQENSYGHPHQETLTRLEAANSHVLMTTECGAITIYSDGKSFWAEGFRE